MNREGLYVNQKTAYIIRFAGLLLPVILSLYTILIQQEIVPTTPSVNPLVAYGICIGWLALALYQLRSPSRSRSKSAILLVLYHLFTASYILFISGFSMPFASAWMILLLTSYAYFKHDGLRLSLLAFFATALADTLLHIDQTEYLTSNTLTMIATFVVSVITVAIMEAQEIDHQELRESRTEKTLERDRILTIVNNLADAVLSTDRNGVIQVYNAASMNLLDTNTPLVGKHIDDILNVYNDSTNQPIKLSAELDAAQGVRTREDLKSDISGETIRLSIIYSPIRSADSHRSSVGDDGYIIILRDITRQKSLEEERDEFISVVSHELRTPITVAEGSLSNVQLMMSRDDIPKTKLVDTVVTAHEQVLFLSKMVNDLSTLSRAERGTADTPEEIDLRALAHELFNEYSPQAEAKGLHFNLDLSPQLPPVSASRLYLKELLQNFITNAIKYTKQGEVTLDIRGQKNGSITCRVSDTGIGISKADQARVFDRFFRSEDYRTRETGGTGLGLYVARKLSKKLGTTIELSSRLNHGSVFSFTLESAQK